MRTMLNRWHRPLLVATIATLVALATALPALAPSGLGGPDAVAAQAPLPYTLEVTPSTGLVDGQAVDVIVRAAPGRRIGVSGKLSICRDGVAYASTNDILPFVGGNCPDRPVSSSGSGPWPVRPYPDGSAAVSTFRVGAGTVEWGPGTDPTQFSLTCDPTNPCRLVVEIPIEGGGRYLDASTLLTFAEEDPFAACGGVDEAAFSAAGPDRMLASWIRWTQQLCAAQGVRAPSQAVLAGEGEGHGAFATGFADLTYSAVGPTYPGAEPPVRASRSVPLALNAAVVGVLGGYGSDAPDWPSAVPHPYEDVKVTIAEMATLFGQGPFLFGPRHQADIQARNLELADALSLSNPEEPNPIAPASSDAVTWVTSSAFDVLAPAQWRTPPMAITGNPPDVDRGVIDSMAAADPPFVSALFELYSAQAQLKKLVAANEFKPYNYGPIWVLTDLATATQLGIPTVALQNAAGEFVHPTEASLLAAVPTLQRQDDGTYLPDVTAAAAAGAYPLTFVEHAVAPAEPLLDDACAARAEAQALLAGWLDHLTGPGQAQLAEGLVPLTDALRTDAVASVAVVGTAAPTGDCAPEEPSPEPAPPAAPGGAPLPGDLLGAGALGGLPGDLGTGSFDGLGGLGSDDGAFGSSAGAGGAGAGGAVAAADVTGGPTAEEDLDEVEVVLPELASATSGTGVAGGTALVVLALLVGLGGLLSSGWRPARGSGRAR